VAKKSLNDCADGKSATVSCLIYGEGDGMASVECPAAFQPAVARREMGGFVSQPAKGLAIVDPADTKVNQLPPPVVIEDIVVNGAC